MDRQGHTGLGDRGEESIVFIGNLEPALGPLADEHAADARQLENSVQFCDRDIGTNVGMYATPQSRSGA